MVSKLIAARFPQDLLDAIEAYGKTHFPKGNNSFDTTKTLHDLISKGLGMPELIAPKIDNDVVVQLVNRLIDDRLNDFSERLNQIEQDIELVK
jgi:hypothetical protein